jgi:hypothetical protein
MVFELNKHRLRKSVVQLLTETFIGFRLVIKFRLMVMEILFLGLQKLVIGNVS